MKDSVHFLEMLKERGILKAWADLTTNEPDRIEERDDGTRHFLKQISEHGGRWLRVIVNVSADPARRVTAFFDRRIKGGL